MTASRVTRALLGFLTFVMPACGEEAEMAPNACGIEEPAMLLPFGQEIVGCLASLADVDQLRVTTPADAAGGYLQISLREAHQATPTLVVYAAAETEAMETFGPIVAGGELSVFIAVAPGQSYRLMIANEGELAQPSTYNLVAAYTPVLDSFEPNDSRAGASPIPVGAPIAALSFAGREGAELDPATYDDYYRFAAAADKVTVKLEDVPVDLAARLFLYRPDGTEVARVSSGQKGGALTLTTPVPVVGGEHVVSVSLWTGMSPPSIGVGTAVPAHFTQPYKLTVTQP